MCPNLALVSPIKNPLLHRYWIEFEPVSEDPTAAAWLTVNHRGVSLTGPRVFGVTAYTLDDALLVLTNEFFSETDMPAIRRVVQDVDDSELGSLARSAGFPEWLPVTDFDPVSWFWRGIWFPSVGHSRSTP